MIAFSETLDRMRRRVALAAVLIVLGLAVASAHSGLVMGEAAMGPVDTACLAVIGATAVLALMGAGGASVAAWPPTPPARRLGGHFLARTMAPPARAGPPQLQVFLN